MQNSKLNLQAFMSRSFMTALFVSLTTFTMLTGCGFHLRGHSQDTLNKGHVESIHITGSLKFNELAIALREQAELIDISLDPSSKIAINVINVDEENSRVGGTQGADIEQYRLKVTAYWELTVDGQLLLPTPLSAQQLYDFLPNNQLGNDQERLLILSELRKRLAQSILRQVIAISNHPPECCEKETNAGGEHQNTSPDSANE